MIKKHLWTDLGILLQSVLASILIFWITRSIPALASGLLNGQPSLGGAGMREMATKAAAAPIAAAGMVKEANRMAKNNGQGGVTGTLMQSGKAAVNSRMPVQAFRGGRQRLRELNDPMYRQRQELYREAKAEEAQKVSKKSDAQQSMEAVQAELNKSDMQAMKKKIEANLPKK